MPVLPPPVPPLLAALAAAAAAEPAYPWFKRAGNHLGGAVAFTAPSNFSEPPAWIWPNSGDELFRHGPVIDDRRRVYAVTSAGWVRKFSPDGKLLWGWRFKPEDGLVLTSPFLHQGRIFLSTTGRVQGSLGSPRVVETRLWSIDMETGEVIWKRFGPPSAGPHLDSHTIHVAEGVLLGPLQDGPMEGNNRIFAVNVSDGSPMWDYRPGGLVWNFMPSTPGDGSAYFATTCGVAHRLRLADGSVIWKSAVEEPIGGAACGTGGGTLGPNGIFYAEANWFAPGAPLPGLSLCLQGNCPGGAGFFVAHRAQDGAVVWAKRIGKGYMGMQYPAVASIGGRLTLVAGVGTNPALPTLQGPKFLPVLVRVWISWLQIRSRLTRRLLGIPVKPNAIVALDAGTGEELWRFDEEPWDHFGAAGDEELAPQRVERYYKDQQYEVICGPDNWGVPSVGADGTVYAGSGSTGRLYALRDADGDGRIDASEVSTFETGNAFLNGPALAPGLLVAAPCWGPMYAWRSG